MKFMARPTKKSIYGRIEEKNNEIIEMESQLAALKDELQMLYDEKDDLEMHQLLDMMKANGLTINQAAELFNNK